MYCKNCGKQIADDTKFCPECGAATQETTQTVNTVLETKQPELIKPVKKKKGCLIFFIIAIVIVMSIYAAISKSLSNSVSGNSTNITDSTKMILDANQYAKISLDELQTLHSDLNDEGGVNLSTASAGTVPGQVYSANDGKETFYLVDGVVIAYQYHADTAVAYERPDDILVMFGISPHNKIKKEADTGSALRYSNVSEKVSDFWVQEMDGKAKSFTTIKITYDSTYAGKLLGEPDKPDLEVLEASSIADGYVSYVIGKIKNNTNKTYKYVQVSINLYKDDVLLGSTLASVNNLEAGKIWEFQAPILYQNCNKYKITDVTGY